MQFYVSPPIKDNETSTKLRGLLSKSIIKIHSLHSRSISKDDRMNGDTGGNGVDERETGLVGWAQQDRQTWSDKRKRGNREWAMEGDFVARSSVTKMIGSTIGGNDNCINGVIITNLEAISSRLDQSEDAPSFPLLDPSRALLWVIKFFSSSFSNLESRSFRRWDPSYCITAPNTKYPTRFCSLQFLSFASTNTPRLAENLLSWRIEGFSIVLDVASRYNDFSYQLAVCCACCRYDAKFQSNLAKFQEFPKQAIENLSARLESVLR